MDEIKTEPDEFSNFKDLGKKLMNIPKSEISKTEILKATHEGILRIGDAEIDVAVLSNGQRVITQTGVFDALGRPQRGNARLINIPVFMDAQNLQQFIDQELMAVINKVEYWDKKGKPQQGFDANILPLVSELYLKARDANKLAPKQIETAKKAEILIRSLAKVAIIALVDEATGYQYERERFELQKILKAYISEEILKWQLTFTDEFYKQIFKLWHIDYTPENIKRKPQFIGHLTNTLIYKKLPKGVFEILKQKTPRTDSGNYKNRLHQSLTPEIGREHLKTQITEITTLMSVADDKADFYRLLEKKYGNSEQLKLDFNEIESSDKC